MNPHQPKPTSTFLMLLVLTICSGLESQVRGQDVPDSPAADTAKPVGQAMEPMARVKFAIATSLAAAQAGDVEGSLAAIRETFGNGCPQKLDIGGFLNSLVGGKSGYENYNRSVVAVAAHGLVQLSSIWRDKKFPPTRVYSTLLPAVMPEAPAGTFWLYDPQTGAVGTQHPTGARLLIEWAVEADRVDDLRERIVARSRKRTYPLAVQLLVELALTGDDSSVIGTELQALDDLIKKQPALAGQASVLISVIFALQDADAAVAALPVAERIGELLAPGAVSAGNFPLVAAILKRAIRMRFELDQTDEARRNVQNWLVIYRTGFTTGVLAQPADWSSHLTEAGHDYLRGGLLNDALAVAGEAVDLNVSETNIVATGLGSLAAGLHRQLATLDTQQRFELLRDWSMPTKERKHVRVLSTLVPGDSPPSVFARALGERPRDDSFSVSTIGGFRGLFSSGWLLVESARDAAALRDLTTRLVALAEQNVPNARFVLTLAQLAAGNRESNGAAAARLGQRIDELRAAYDQRMSSPSVDENAESLITFNDIVLAAACAQHAQFEKTGFELLSLLPESPHRHAILTRSYLRRIRAAAIIDREPDASRKIIDAAEFRYWDPGQVEHAVSSEGTVRPTWLAHDGHLTCLAGSGHDYLTFRYPLTGTFQLSCDMLETPLQPPGGLLRGDMIWQASGMDQTLGITGLSGQYVNTLPNQFLPRTLQPRYHRLALNVTDQDVSVSINGRRVWNGGVSTETAPWIGVKNNVLHASVFRDLTITGDPEIPRDVKLLDGNDLGGWQAEYFGQSVPVSGTPMLSGFAQPAIGGVERQAVTLAPSNGPVVQDATRKGVEQTTRVVFANPESDSIASWNSAGDVANDWFAQNGVLHCNQKTADISTTAQSRLYYFRPLQNGESLSYEFLYQPGVFEVHPALGRLAFLLKPGGVRVHWMTSERHEWTGLGSDNAVLDPANRRGPRTPPLIADDWNKASISLADDIVTLTLNDTVVYSRAVESDARRTFSFYHDRLKSGVRVRNVVLHGDWPERLEPEQRNDLLALSDAPQRVPDRRALASIFDDVHIGDTALAVHRHAVQLPAEARFAYLADWVLPGIDHDTIRVALDFTPTHPAPVGRDVDRIDEQRVGIAAELRQSRVQIGGNLIAPALDLIETAQEAGKLDEVKERAEQFSPRDTQQTQARLTLLMLADSALGDFTAANSHLDKLFALVDADSRTDFESRWPETLAIYAATQEPATRELGRELAVLVFDRQLGLNKPSGVAAWESFVRAMVGQARFFDGSQDNKPANRTTERYWVAPQLREWDPVSRTTARSRGQGLARAHWQASTDRVENTSSHETDFMYYHIPLQGNFQVECDLDAFRGRDTTMSIGGSWLLTAYNQAAYTFGDYRRQLGRVEITPKLSLIRFQLHFRGVVEDGSYRAFINGREVRSEALPQPFEPWIAIQSRERHDGGVSNLQITGDPVIPDVIPMTASSNLASWLGYYDESVGTKNSHWRQRGDIPGGGGIVGLYRPGLEGCYVERLLRYHRPMLEDGSIEYEFYYREGVSLVHPVLDRRALLLTPDGVRIHWVTDGPFDRTELGADNVTDEPENRRGPDVLPLTPNAWNHTRLTLTGNVVELFLNEQLVYERELEITNQRTFGLFHYTGQTEARVRSMKWRGDWPRELPALSDQELAGPNTQILDQRLPELKAVFHHDFAAGGFDTSRFALVRNMDGGVLNHQPQGLQVVRLGGDAYMATLIAPAIAVRGDFDISVSFEQFETQLTAGSHAAAMLQLIMTGKTTTESLVSRRHTLSTADLSQQIVHATAAERSDEDSRRFQLANSPGESPSGAFRIARRGDQISYLYSEGDKAPFRILAVKTATTDDIEPKHIRLHMQAKGAAHSTIVWKSITVRAEKLLRLPDPNNPVPGLLWVMDADGTELQKITEPIAGYQNHGSPSWSPDGKKILFDCWGGSPDKSKMFMVNPDGTEMKELGTGAMPSFSPDGKKIAFTAGDGMTVMDVDGSNREVVDERGWSVQWSPDGRMLAYGNGGNITVLDLDTKEKRSILEGEHASLYNYTYWNLEWSRDSRRVCFKARTRSTSKYELVVADVTGSSNGFEVVFSSPTEMQTDFTWHPDGDRVLFPMNVPEKRTASLFAVSLRNPGKAELWPQQPDMRIQGIDWSRDGKRIVVAAANPPDWQSKLDELPAEP